MQSNFFTAVKPGNIIGDGTVGALTAWLEKWVNIVFPENAIEYWADPQHAGPETLKRSFAIPAATVHKDATRDFCCYVTRGRCEGNRIEVLLEFSDQKRLKLCSAKHLGRTDECWQIARSIQEALYSIYFYHEIPMLVDMAAQIPRTASWSREARPTEIVIHKGQNTLDIVTGRDQILDTHDWSGHGDAAGYYVASFLKDWELVLNNMKANYRILESNRIDNDLIGYTVTQRGVADITGFYVLPPGGNPRDDREWLGYFQKWDLAIAAAREHRKSQTQLGTVVQT